MAERARTAVLADSDAGSNIDLEGEKIPKGRDIRREVGGETNKRKTTRAGSPVFLADSDAASKNDSETTRIERRFRARGRISLTMIWA